MKKTPKAGDRTTISITRKGVVIAILPAYWVWGPEGLMKVTVPN